MADYSLLAAREKILGANVMYTSVLSFRRPLDVFERGAYYLAPDIKSHQNLVKLRRWFMGDEIRGVFSLHDAAVVARGRRVGRRGRPRSFVFHEVIVSSPPGAGLEESEVSKFSSAILDSFGATGAMVGGHWHRTGRVDFHILLVNDTFSGEALGTSQTLPSTGRGHRNIEVVARQYADSAHIELNERRRAQGLPVVATMESERDEKKQQRILAEKKARDDLIASSRAWSVLLNGKVSPPTVAAVAVSATTLPPVEPKAEAFRRSPNWEELTAVVYRWAYSGSRPKLADKYFLPRSDEPELLVDISHLLEADCAGKGVQAEAAKEAKRALEMDRLRRENEREEKARAQERGPLM